MPMGPTIYFGLKNVVLRHDLKEKPENISEALPHLIFNNFSSSLVNNFSIQYDKGS
jgi:U3 small nucleolar ribonucleoprotein protein IMP4